MLFILTLVFLHSIKKMLESGQMSRLWSKWQTKPVVGCLGDGQEPLQIGTVAAVFVILGSAAGFSLLLLVGEIGIRWANKR